MISEAASRDDLNGRFIPSHLAKLRGNKSPKDFDKMPGFATSSGSTWKQQRTLTLHAFKRLGVGNRFTEMQTLKDVKWLCSTLKAKNCLPVDVKFHLDLIGVKAIRVLCTGDDLKPDNPELLEIQNLLNNFYTDKGKPVNRMLALNPSLGNLALKFNLWEGGKQLQLSLLASMKNYIALATSMFKTKSEETFVSKYIHLAKDRRRRSNKESTFEAMDHTNLTNILMDLFIAGGDTTSTTLSWALLFMILHPDIQEKVHHELSTVVGKGVQPLASERQFTPYTQAVLLEVQRLASVADKAVPHRATEDCHLSTGHFIPKDTMVLLWLGSVFRNSKIFPNPEAFDPNRHLDDTGAFSPHPKVIPFGLGKRQCPGKALARTQIYMVFTGLMSMFKLEKAHENDYISTVPIDGVSLSPASFKIIFKPRNE